MKGRVQDETNKVLHLSRIRDRYPPLTTPEIIFNLNNPMVFFSNRTIDLFFGSIIYAITENVYASLSMIAIATFFNYKLIDSVRGENAFRELGVELDESTINELVAESYRNGKDEL